MYKGVDMRNMEWNVGRQFMISKLIEQKVRSTVDQMTKCYQSCG